MRMAKVSVRQSFYEQRRVEPGTKRIKTPAVGLREFWCRTYCNPYYWFRLRFYITCRQDFTRNKGMTNSCIPWVRRVCSASCVFAYSAKECIRLSFRGGWRAWNFKLRSIGVTSRANNYDALFEIRNLYKTLMLLLPTRVEDPESLIAPQIISRSWRIRRVPLPQSQQGGPFIAI